MQAHASRGIDANLPQEVNPRYRRAPGYQLQFVVSSLVVISWDLGRK
jgi:hypothetical protein